MLFLEFTAGELLVRSCRSALQARIAAESRSYSKIFCNDRVNAVSGARSGYRAPAIPGVRASSLPVVGVGQATWLKNQLGGWLQA